MISVRTQVYPTALVTLSLMAISIYLLRFWGFRVEDLQTAAFPLILAAAWSVPRDRRFSIPSPVIFGVLLLWAVSALHVRGYLPGRFVKEGLYLARLDGDSSGTLGRTLFWNYNRYASEHALPQINMIERQIKSDANASAWLRAHSKASLLLRGNAEWMRLVLPPAAAVFPDSVRSVPADVRAEAEKFGFTDSSEISFIQPAGFPVPVAVVLVPEGVTISSQPIELTRDFLGYLGDALGTQDLTDDSLTLERRRLGFLTATSVEGNWRSSAPRAMSQLLAGTVELLLSVKDSDPAQLACAKDTLYRAADRVQPRFAPDVAAAIYNNTAMTVLLESRLRKDLRNVRTLLLTAIQLNEGSTSSRGARAALLNLMLLERAGVL